MKKVLLIATGILISGGIVFANQFEAMGLRFVAPTVNDKANVYQPEAGEIVFDSSDSKFYGRTDASQWVDMSAVSTSQVPVGTILPFAGTSAPAGYVLADGSAVSRTGTYANLFAAIGTAFGVGDGSTTFNLPDLRGRFMRGLDGSAGNDPDKASRTATNSGNSGNNVGSLQGDQYASHTHTTGGQYNANSTSAGLNGFPASTAGTVNNTNTTSGSAGGNETRPKNIYVNFIIKL